MSGQHHTPAALFHGNYTLNDRLGCSHSRSGCCGEERNLCRDSNPRSPGL